MPSPGTFLMRSIPEPRLQSHRSHGTRRRYFRCRRKRSVRHRRRRPRRNFHRNLGIHHRRRNELDLHRATGNSNGRLLAANALTRIRYRPNPRVLRDRQARRLGRHFRPERRCGRRRNRGGSTPSAPSTIMRLCRFPDCNLERASRDSVRSESDGTSPGWTRA